MKASSTRRAAFAALALAPALAACGFGAQTDQVYQPATGVNDRNGQVDVLNALIVSGDDGSGTLAATLVNNSESESDELTSVTGDGVQSDLSSPVKIPAGGLVNLAESGDVSVTGDAVKPGGFVSLAVTFADGYTSNVRVPVVGDDGDYAQVPLPSASESPTGTATQGPGAASTETPTGQPSQEPTGSAG